MSRRITHPNSILQETTDDLFYLINLQKKPYLVQDDFIKFCQSRDFLNGLENFDASKYFNFVEKGTFHVTKKSFKEGYEKETENLKNEIEAIREKFELETALIKELERTSLNESSVLLNDEGVMLGAKMHVSVIRARSMQIREDFSGRIAVVIRSGEINLMTEPSNYSRGQCFWANEKFTLPIFHGREDIYISVYEVFDETNYEYLGHCEIKLESLKDQGVHKRYYKLFNNENFVCEVLLNLLYIYDQGQYDEAKIERRKETYRATQKRNKVTVKLLEEKYHRLTTARGFQLFEELFSKGIELPSFLSPNSYQSPRFKIKSETEDYISEAPSIYNDDVQLKIFLTGNDEERILFERITPRLDTFEASSVLENNSDKIDFQHNNHSPEQLRTSILDMPLSDSDSNRLYKPPSRASSEKKRRMQRREEHHRSTSMSYTKVPDFLMNDPNLSSIHYNNSMSENDSHLYYPSSHSFILGKPNLSINVSAIPSTKSNKNAHGFAFPRQMPSVIYDEDEGMPTTKRPNRVGTAQKAKKKDSKREFYEKAVLLGLAQLVKMKKIP